MLRRGLRQETVGRQKGGARVFGKKSKTACIAAVVVEQMNELVYGCTGCGGSPEYGFGRGSKFKGKGSRPMSEGIGGP